jgi:hypothetical protein
MQNIEVLKWIQEIVWVLQAANAIHGIVQRMRDSLSKKG